MSKNGDFDTNATLLVNVLFWLSAFYVGGTFYVGLCISTYNCIKRMIHYSLAPVTINPLLYHVLD